MDMSRPGRVEWYIMGLMCVVQRLFAKQPHSIQPANFQMQFERGTPRKSAEDRKRQIEFSKAQAIARGGGLDRFTILNAKGEVIRGPKKGPRRGNSVRARSPRDKVDA